MSPATPTRMWPAKAALPYPIFRMSGSGWSHRAAAPPCADDGLTRPQVWSCLGKPQGLHRPQRFGRSGRGGPYCFWRTEMAQPLMPHATASWLVDNTALSFEQIAQFRSEEHTSELQSLMRTSYAVFSL